MAERKQPINKREPVVYCTGVSAFWCPVCGDCNCERLPTGECCFDSADCPLHRQVSKHADTVELGECRARITEFLGTIAEAQVMLATTPPTGEPAPVATERDGYSRCEAVSELTGRRCIVCCPHDGHIFPPGKPLAESPAEVSHAQARWVTEALASPHKTQLLAYVAQCEARQQQAEREVEELRAGYPDACDKFQDQIRKVAAERDALQARVAELRKELQSTWNKMKRQQENLSGLNATIQGWVTRATHAEEQVKKMGLDNLEKLARHAKLTDELRAERERLQARVAELEASKERLRESRRLERVRATDAEIAMTELQSEREAMKARVAELEGVEKALRTLAEAGSKLWLHVYSDGTPWCQRDDLPGFGNHEETVCQGATVGESLVRLAERFEAHRQRSAAEPPRQEPREAETWRPNGDHVLDGPSSRGAFALLSDANADHTGKFREAKLSQRNVIWLLLHAGWNLARRVDVLERERGLGK